MKRNKTSATLRKNNFMKIITVAFILVACLFGNLTLAQNKQVTTYEIKAPDGKTYSIEGPPGATNQEVLQAIIAQNPEAGISKQSKIDNKITKDLYLPLPDGTYLKLHDGESATDGWLRAEKDYPEAFTVKKENQSNDKNNSTIPIKAQTSDIASDYKSHEMSVSITVAAIYIAISIAIWVFIKNRIKKNENIQRNNRTGYGSIWHRFLAHITDSMLVSFPTFAFVFLYYLINGLAPTQEKYYIYQSILFSAAAFIAYRVLMQCSKSQGTHGQQLFKLKIVDKSGNRITPMRSLIRQLFEIISSIFFIGYIFIAFSNKKQTLHDMVAGTFFVYRGQNLVADKNYDMDSSTNDNYLHQPYDKSIEDRNWEMALAELNSGIRIDSVWARAYSESDGDENKSKAKYIRYRAQQLANQSKSYQ